MNKPKVKGDEMEYCKTVTLKDGSSCLLRNGTAADGQALLDIFILTHEETDYLLTYADECTMTAEDEAKYLAEKTEDPRSIEILAERDGQLVGSAGIEVVRDREKLRHRAEFGISVVRACWGLGIGRALADACIECAREAGYVQLELDVVAENVRAIALYQSLGFVEWGRNPKGFRTRDGRWQELVLMRLELGEE